MFLTLAVLAAAPPVPGVVIAHSPAASRQYIGSPSLLKLADGSLLASHDLFGPGSTWDITHVYHSADNGRTWAKRAEMKGQWWSTLFAHRDAIYLMGTTKEYGHTVIRHSTDSGKTWTTPADAKSGLLLEGMYHCAPVPVVVHNGRLWRGMEQYDGPKWGAFRAFMMSAAVDADLLDAANWTSSNRLNRDPAWLGGTFQAWLEGNAVVTPAGKVVDILRVQQPNYIERAAIVRVSDDGTTATFDPTADFIIFPGGAKKFTIRFDPVSKRYWTLVNECPKEYRLAELNPGKVRNTLSLMSSADLREWKVSRKVLSSPDVTGVGFQYCDWLFDGEDIIAAVRTAFVDAAGSKAHNPHDANHLTFHRVSGFRK